jgi:hypothetical protein
MVIKSVPILEPLRWSSFLSKVYVEQNTGWYFQCFEFVLFLITLQTYFYAKCRNVCTKHNHSNACQENDFFLHKSVLNCLILCSLYWAQMRAPPINISMLSQIPMCAYVVNNNNKKLFYDLDCVHTYVCTYVHMYICIIMMKCRFFQGPVFIKL